MSERILDLVEAELLLEDCEATAPTTRPPQPDTLDIISVTGLCALNNGPFNLTLTSRFFVILILSTSSLIRPFYTIRAAILKKVFRPKKFPKTEKQYATPIKEKCLNILPSLNFHDNLHLNN